MYQDCNGNYQHRELADIFTRLRSTLPSVYEDKCLYNVPDVNLECDETIDDWDNLEAGIYSPTRDEKQPVQRVDFVDIDYKNRQLNYGEQLPSSSVASFEEPSTLLVQNHYVNSLLQLWRESQQAGDQHALPINQVNTDDKQAIQSPDCVQSIQVGFSMPSDDAFASQEMSCSSDGQSQQSDNGHLSLDCAVPKTLSSSKPSTAEEAVLVSSSDENNLDGEPEQLLQIAPESGGSSRSSSPFILEMLQRQTFTALNSFSPDQQFPSPLSSRSSSPRYLRSPSPLEYLERSMVTLPLDDPNDLVFYEDRYILRSYSPVSTGSTDHQVPDVNTEFQQTVSHTEEFPSFSPYRRRRVQNSCQDQVVPDFIEE